MWKQLVWASGEKGKEAGARPPHFPAPTRFRPFLHPYPARGLYRGPPSWAGGMGVDSEGGVAVNRGDCFFESLDSLLRRGYFTGV